MRPTLQQGAPRLRRDWGSCYPRSGRRPQLPRPPRPGGFLRRRSAHVRSHRQRGRTPRCRRLLLPFQGFPGNAVFVPGDGNAHHRCATAIPGKSPPLPLVSRRKVLRVGVWIRADEHRRCGGNCAREGNRIFPRRVCRESRGRKALPPSIKFRRFSDSICCRPTSSSDPGKADIRLRSENGRTRGARKEERLS